MRKTAELRQRMADVIEQYLQLDNALRKAEGHHFRVCIFGSARIQPHDEIYNEVYEVSTKLAQMGVDIVTGGGPGLMEAANRAVHDANIKKVRSYGLPLDIPGIKELPNPHLDIKSMHRRFSSRLDEFMRLSDGVVIAPGGIGTMLELFYVWQLLQLSMVDPRPVVLLGREFWSGIIEWMKGPVLGHRLISPEDMDFLIVVDTPEEVVAAIAPALEAYNKRRREGNEQSRAQKATDRRKALRQAREIASTLTDMKEELVQEGVAQDDGQAQFEPEEGILSPKVVTPVEAVTEKMRRTNQRKRARNARNPGGRRRA